MSLMLHCGAEAITRQELANVLPVNGALGNRHNPVPYIDFVEQFINQMQQYGLELQDEAYGVTKEGARMFGLLKLKSLYSEYAPMIGVRGSYDQTLPRAAAVGSNVFVCDNLAFSGDVVMKTKQTTFIQRRMSALIESMCYCIPNMIELQHKKFDAYKNKEIKPRTGDAALIELVRRKALAPSQLGKAIQEWDEPSHVEHSENGHSVWRLHNAVTEAIKPANPERSTVLGNMNKTIPMTKFFDEFCGIDF